MYIIHQHPTDFPGDQQRLDHLQALHRACLMAIQRQHRASPPVAPGSARGR